MVMAAIYLPFKFSFNKLLDQGRAGRHGSSVASSKAVRRGSCPPSRAHTHTKYTQNSRQMKSTPVLTWGARQKRGHNSNSTGGCTRGRDSRFEGDYPGHRAHPTPPCLACSPPRPSWLPNLAGFDARDAAPSGPFQKVGSRKLQGVIVPALAWIPVHRVPPPL